MPSDPQIFNPVADPGKMKHTLTGLRTVFPNTLIHHWIDTYYKPLRQLLMTAAVSRGTAPLTQPMITAIQTRLVEARDYIKRNVDNVSSAPMPSLEKRKQALKTLQDDLLHKEMDALLPETDKNANFADVIQIPSFIMAQTVSFDYEGLTSADFAQPTEGRIRNPGARTFIKALDMLLVYISNMPSMDLPNTILFVDGASICGGLQMLYTIAQNIGNSSESAALGTTVAAFDGLFNAAGTFDPLMSAGSGELGDLKIPPTVAAAK